MIKKIDIFGISIIFLVLILILLNSNQIKISNDSINYIGTIVLESNQIISFSLKIKEKKGIVSGLSITNINQKDETISNVLPL